MEVLDEIAALAGIEPEYYDNWGRKHIASQETKRAILSSMDIEVSEASLHRMQNSSWLTFIEPVLVVSENEQPPNLQVRFPLEAGREAEVSVSVKVRDESGRKDLMEFEGVTPVEKTEIDGSRYVCAELPFRTDRKLGYYTVSVACRTPDAEHTGRMRLIVTPDLCYEPRGISWGLYANLYALRSKTDWGVGDFSDLGALTRWVGKELGGGFVGINPLHAIPNTMPYGISPYSSASRMYMNFIYLDMEGISDDPGYRELINSSEFRVRIESLRSDALIDYEGVASAKIEALRAAFRAFMDNEYDREGSSDAKDLKRYIRREGRALETYATYAALDEHFRRESPDLYQWKDWPSDYHDPDGKAVRKFRKEHAQDVIFFQYVQWQLNRQLEAIGTEAREAGMAVGLYGDLAVGSSSGGSDAWSYPEVFAFGMDAGAPPDAFNLNGQSWGFPPFVPHKLRESGYELFIQTIRHNLRYLGALRIDHAPGLYRLFWVPHGMSPADGTYICYPYEDLLRIIALESVRNKTIIIAEDLGTVAPELREAIHRFGMLSYKLFYFERRWPEPDFVQPNEYPAMALTAVTTHDLPTLHGFWRGRDIEVKSSLGLYPDEDARQRDLNDREQDRRLIMDTLCHCLPEGTVCDIIPEEMTPELSVCIHRYLAQTPCKMVCVSLDDVLGTLDQQNLPGTIDTHPNWRQKCPVSLEELTRNEKAADMADMFRETNR